MGKTLLYVPCDICEYGQATRVAHYHPGLLLCKGCLEEEPRPEEEDAQQTTQ